MDEKSFVDGVSAFFDKNVPFWEPYRPYINISKELNEHVFIKIEVNVICKSTLKVSPRCYSYILRTFT